MGLLFLIYIGTDRPTHTYLFMYVIPHVAARWFHIGLELLDKRDEAKLLEIEAKYNGYERCANVMFTLWLQRRTDASWNQLIQALRQPSVSLSYLATRIENMLLKEKDGLSKGIITIL